MKNLKAGQKILLKRCEGDTRGGEYQDAVFSRYLNIQERVAEKATIGAGQTCIVEVDGSTIIAYFEDIRLTT